LLISVSDLPAVNATLNATSALLLTVGHFFIRRDNLKAHRAFMISAFATSTLFLISYLVYHYYHGSTPFRGEGWIRPLYFFILISHTTLAAVIVPLALLTLSRALKKDFEKHRKIAVWTYPVWIYVSVTGVVVYLLLYQIYPQG
jgi:uncharacterized membrane protein YozB (DUF420 family)